MKVELQHYLAKFILRITFIVVQNNVFDSRLWLRR